MKFYWIDCHKYYEKKFIEKVHRIFTEIYEPLASSQHIDFSFVEALDIDIVIDNNNGTRLLYKNRDLLKDPGCAIVQYSNINPQAEKHVESIYRVYRAKNKLFNNSPNHEFVDRDKLLGMSIANSLELITLPTISISNRDDYWSFIDMAKKHLGEPPYILKPKELLSGLGIVRVESLQHFQGLLDIIVNSSHDYILQKFLKNAEDYRVYVFDGVPSYCLLRKTSNADSYLANVSHGGTSLSIPVPNEIKDNVFKIYNKIKANYLCVDFLKHEGKFYFNEIELSGGFASLKGDDLKGIGKMFFGCAKKHFS